MKLLSKKIDLGLLMLWPLIAGLISISWPINAFLSPLLFYGVPALLLSMKMRRIVGRTAALSLLIIPTMIMIDYIAELTGTWLWPIPDTVFGFRFFNLVSIEVLIWAYLHAYFVVLFYEYFLDKQTVKRLWHPRIRQVILFTLVLFLMFLCLLILQPQTLQIRYWYLVWGLVFILPPALFVELCIPTLFIRFTKAATYFAFLNIVYEIVALKNSWWAFPGNEFIGWVSFFGVTFPFEEFFFWIILFVFSILCYYEYFMDDGK